MIRIHLSMPRSQLVLTKRLRCHFPALQGVLVPFQRGHMRGSCLQQHTKKGWSIHPTAAGKGNCCHHPKANSQNMKVKELSQISLTQRQGGANQKQFFGFFCLSDFNFFFLPFASFCLKTETVLKVKALRGRSGREISNNFTVMLCCPLLM